MKIIIANIPAKKIVKNGKTWKFDARIETITQDDQGNWSGEDIGRMLEDEVIDLCKSASNWPQIKAAHFVMDGFHN